MRRDSLAKAHAQAQAHANALAHAQAQAHARAQAQQAQAQHAQAQTHAQAQQAHTRGHAQTRQAHTQAYARSPWTETYAPGFTPPFSPFFGQHPLQSFPSFHPLAWWGPWGPAASWFRHRLASRFPLGRPTLPEYAMHVRRRIWGLFILVGGALYLHRGTCDQNTSTSASAPARPEWRSPIHGFLVQTVAFLDTLNALLSSPNTSTSTQNPIFFDLVHRFVTLRTILSRIHDTHFPSSLSSLSLPSLPSLSLPSLSIPQFLSSIFTACASFFPSMRVLSMSLSPLAVSFAPDGLALMGAIRFQFQHAAG
ncbi:hypothetical protein R3P38DRAFT_3206274 [Favolaschia claudopus]|uniref:Uncharacterized protein n=1 Tax=Favolaschia claudopus TaxID=2862362 RepID=A0AAW0ALB1_9AGAR